MATFQDPITFEQPVTMQGDLTFSGANMIQTEQKVIPAALGRAGATATVGYVNTGTDLGSVTLAASATADTWVIPCLGLNVGDTITAFKVVAQIESAGGTVTLDADLRKLTNAAGDPTDASLGTITQVSVTTDTAVSSSKTLATAEVIASGEVPYVLITCTTAASTDVVLLAAELTVTTG